MFARVVTCFVFHSISNFVKKMNFEKMLGNLVNTDKATTPLSSTHILGSYQHLKAANVILSHFIFEIPKLNCNNTGGKIHYSWWIWIFAITT